MSNDSTQVVAYCRTATQDPDSGLRTQREAITAYCRGEGLTVVGWLLERAASTDDEHPPILGMALRAMEKGELEVDGIVASGLDRLSRHPSLIEDAVKRLVPGGHVLHIVDETHRVLSHGDVRTDYRP